MDPVSPQSTNQPLVNSSDLSSPQSTKDGHWVTILAMALFVLGSLAVVAFLYYQNQQLKSIIVSYQTPTINTPPPTFSPVETQSASPSATPKTVSMPTISPSASPSGVQ